MISRIIASIRKTYRGLPDKKIYLEFITAALTIPVLITVLLNNINGLNKTQNAAPTPSPTQITSPSPIPPTASQKENIPSQKTPSSPQNTSSPAPTCVPLVGDIIVTSPTEHEQISQDPVCLDIDRTGSGYCPIVWSYRINGGPWSEYSDKNVCFYGLSPGEKTVSLKAKSIVSSDETTTQRTFTIKGPTATPTVNISPTPEGSPSGKLN